MLTSPYAVLVRDDRPGYRPYEVTVTRLTELSPHFVRVTFTGPDLSTFGTDGLDQRIKLMFPVNGELPRLGADWWETWRSMPNEARNPIRTYTVRAVRQGAAEIDVDFVAHGDGGPAARWLLTAAIGDPLVIVGPDAHSVDSAGGIDWHPGSATDVLLAGDETATPAICSILESLPAGMRATAFIEVPSRSDVLPLESAADVSVTWLARDEHETLEPAVRAWVDAHNGVITLAPSPQEVEDVDVDVDLLWDAPLDAEGSFYAWLAGEASVIKSLRRLLVSERGVDRRRVAFMGYWRLGRAEGQE